jgi:cytochrome c oxidase subunit 2
MATIGQRHDDETAPRRGERRWRRVPSVVALAATLLILAGCSPYDFQPYSTISPQTGKTEDIQWLYQIIFWAALIVFIGVQMAIVYTVIRFRRRGDARPAQIHGSRKLEIAWTVIPAVILLVIFIPTAQVIFAHANAEANATDAFDVQVIGKQWWWEIHYPDIPANPDEPEAGPLVTANEVILPQGANVVFHLDTNNVVHSFWVPQLSGKTDLLPGHDNRLQFVARDVGDYFGECAEFCGSAHAWMRFKVKIVPPEAFDAWVAAWRTPPTSDADPATEEVAEAPAAFANCLVCHRVSGTNAQLAEQGIGANPGYVDPLSGDVFPGPGPNLTLMGCRDSIGAGILENTQENMETWLRATDDVKEGVYMPNYYELGLITDEQVTELAAYLESLRPAEGCPTDGLPVGGEVAPETIDFEAIDQ